MIKRYQDYIHKIIEDLNKGIKPKAIMQKYNIGSNHYYSWLNKYKKEQANKDDGFSEAVHEVMERQHKETKKDLEREVSFLIESVRCAGDINNTLHAVKNSKQDTLIKQLLEQKTTLLASLQRLSKSNSEMLDYILGQL